MNQFYFDAIYAVYPNAVTINSDSIVFDSMDNEIDIDQNVISDKIAELEAAEPMRLLRLERNRRLAATDWRILDDYPMTNKLNWKTYRQALRDLPATAEPELDENGMLTNVTWPEEPA